MTEKLYEEWLEQARNVSPPTSFVDQIMIQVANVERQRRVIWWMRLIQMIERSRAARIAVWGGALAIGGLPFVFLAYVAQFLTF